jgi:hypothetical protein
MPRKFTKRKPPSRSAKSKAKPNQAGGDKEAQYARFLEAAREAEASTDPKDFDKAFKPVVSRRPTSS